MSDGGLEHILRTLEVTCKDDLPLKKMLTNLLWQELDQSSVNWHWRETYRKAIQKTVKEVNHNED